MRRGTVGNGLPSRRDFLKTLGVAAGAAALSGCARQLGLWEEGRGVVGASTGLPAPSQTTTPSPFPTSTTIPTPTPPPAVVDIPTFPPTPDPRKLCFVLWDHQLAMYGYRPRNLFKPVPETVPLRSGANNRLTPIWINYWQGILRLLNPAMHDHDFEIAWKSLLTDNRAFTNDSGLGRDNFGLHSITCGGATHEMVTGEREGDWMRIYTLNINDNPPPIPDDPHQIDMTRHFFATTGSHDRLADGTYAVYGFPQFENCIVPLVSPDDTDLIAVDRIKAVNQIRSPYNLPPRECYPPFGCPTEPVPFGTPAS